MRGRGTLWRRSPALASGRADLSCWGLSVGPCLPAPLLLLKPPLNLLSLSRLALLLSVSLHVSVHFFLCLSFSVSRALLPSPPPHPPFSWREVHRYQFLRATPPRCQHRVFCMSCFHYATPHFLPQIAQARPLMGWQLSLPGSFLCHQGERQLDVGAEFSALGHALAPPLHPR